MRALINFLWAWPKICTHHMHSIFSLQFPPPPSKSAPGVHEFARHHLQLKSDQKKDSCIGDDSQCLVLLASEKEEVTTKVDAIMEEATCSDKENQ